MSFHSQQRFPEISNDSNKKVSQILGDLINYFLKLKMILCPGSDYGVSVIVSTTDTWPNVTATPLTV